MRSHRGSWLGSSILAAAVLLMPAVSTVQAQPGFGPDPFWPYNNQYTPYVTPMGPAGPAGGQGDPSATRDGLRGANQFQEYLDSIQGGPGPGRNISDRSNVGMPYYRSAVDPAYETRNRGPRQYQANLRSNERFEVSQQRVSDIYFRYYTERNPARRAELLRQYRSARREAEVAISGRGRSPSRVLDASNRLDAASRRGARFGAGAPGSSDVDDRLGPAPAVPTVRSRASSTAAPRRNRPADVLRRSEAMDRGGAGAFPAPPRPSAANSGPAAPRTNPTLDDYQP